MWQKIRDWWDGVWFRWLIRRTRPKTPEEAAAREKRAMELLGIENQQLWYLQKKNPEPEAELQALRRYLELHPKSKNAKQRCLTLLRELRRDDEALALCEANLGDFPVHEYVLRLNKAEIYLRNGQEDVARETLREAQESRGFKRKSVGEFLLEAELDALAGERESAARLLKRALWNTADDTVQPVREKVVALQQRYGL